MKHESFSKLAENITKAKSDMEAALRVTWPEGSRVEVFLNYRQEMPTAAVVVGHNGDGYVRVKISSAKENSRRRFRDIYFDAMGQSCQKPFRKKCKEAP